MSSESVRAVFAKLPISERAEHGESVWGEREFLDEELSRFIVSGRLNCTIDAVEGVLRTNRPDKKNALYQQFVKDGDALLNRIQKLSRVIDL